MLGLNMVHIQTEGQNIDGFIHKLTRILKARVMRSDYLIQAAKCRRVFVVSIRRLL
jgi:hypothetical protein